MSSPPPSSENSTPTPTLEEDMKFPCGLCTRKFMQRVTMNSHRRKAHNASPVFSEKFEKMQKSKMKKDPKLASTGHVCRVCNDSFRTLRLLYSHPCYPNNTPSICLMCNELIPSYEFPKDHLSRHHEIKNSTDCCCCSWTFRNQLKMINHEKLLFHGKMGDIGFSVPSILNSFSPGSFLSVTKNVNKKGKEALENWQNINYRMFSVSIASYTSTSGSLPSVSTTSENPDY
ncbi:hypothetical protein L5515_004955 [Caenorhabditis briggsae]|uniref:C2H2-type domain-containing protein n=1 Tax=Caenorhabditis briggsae TaxID=6238 RepID=A0AAE9EJ23_CAEBR|nr:hypothetical protein L5515_004955 [Caenorhabditis briggsae]